MTLGCTCGKYADLELSRPAVDQRIGKTRGLRKALRLLVESPSKWPRLYKCETCEQFWQESEAWGWDNWGKPIYLFKVPAISTAEWLQEPYIQPHELLVFGARVERVLENILEKNEPCAVSGCLSTVCRITSNPSKKLGSFLRTRKDAGSLHIASNPFVQNSEWANSRLKRSAKYVLRRFPS